MTITPQLMKWGTNRRQKENVIQTISYQYPTHLTPSHPKPQVSKGSEREALTSHNETHLTTTWWFLSSIVMVVECQHFCAVRCGCFSSFLEEAVCWQCVQLVLMPNPIGQCHFCWQCVQLCAIRAASNVGSLPPCLISQVGQKTSDRCPFPLTEKVTVSTQFLIRHTMFSLNRV